MNTFESRFDTEFRVLEVLNKGSYGTPVKVKPRLRDGEELDSKEVLAEENPELEFISSKTTVIKIVKPITEEGLLRAQDEAKLFMGLKHVNIINVLDFWIERPPPSFVYRNGSHGEELTTLLHPSSSSLGLLFIHLEYADKRNLRHWMISPWKKREDAIVICDSIARGLSYLHSHNIIHRDLKPENVLIATMNSAACVVKICDFGSAVKIQEDGRKLTSKLGTDGYIAPEVEESREYTTKADIYSLGVMFTELIVATQSLDSEDSRSNSNQFYMFLGSTYPFQPLLLRDLYPSLLNEMDAHLASSMCCEDPFIRLTASECESTFGTLYNRTSRGILPFYDYSPYSLTICGPKGGPHLGAESIMLVCRKSRPELVTKVILHHINMDAGSVWSNILSRFVNLEHLEISMENRANPDFPCAFQDFQVPKYDLNAAYESELYHPIPHLKTFKFEQLRFNDGLQNYWLLHDWNLQHLMFFMPWPYYKAQLWKNKMQLWIKFRNRMTVNIDPDEGHFHLSGSGSRALTPLLEREEFHTICMTNLDEPMGIGAPFSYVKVQQILEDAIHLNHLMNPTILRKLIIVNTSVFMYNDGGLFTRFPNLEELHFQAEVFWEFKKRRQRYSFRSFPRSLKKLLLGSVSVELPELEEIVGNKYTLDYLGFDGCTFPQEFETLYPHYFEVKRLSVFNNIKQQKRPTFKLVESVLGTDSWRQLVICQLDSKIASHDAGLLSFGGSNMQPLYNKFAVPLTHPDIEFTQSSDQTNNRLNLRALPLHENHRIEILDVMPTYEGLDEVVSKGLEFAPAKAVPSSKSLPLTLDSEDSINPETTKERNPISNENAKQSMERRDDPTQFYFDGGNTLSKLKRSDMIHNLYPLPPRLPHKRYREIVLRNVSVGNVSQYMWGCKWLEVLILENVRWGNPSALKIPLPQLRKYHVFENVLTGHAFPRIGVDKIKTFLFFLKDGIQGLWGRDLDLVISVQSQMNVVLSRMTGEVILQRVEEVDNVLLEIDIDETFTSLVLNNCDVALSSIPFWLTSINIRHVGGLMVSELMDKEKFPLLRNLYYDAHRDNLQSFHLEDVPFQLNNLLLGGLFISGVASLSCTNLTFLNCVFCPEFYSTYPIFFSKIQKLLFLGGSTRTPNFDELKPLLHTPNLTWVGFRMFDLDTSHNIVYYHDTKKKYKELIPSDIVGDREEMLAWLRNRVSPWNQRDDSLVDFILERRDPSEDWTVCFRHHRSVETEEDKILATVEEDTFGTFEVISGRYKIAESE